MKFPGKVPRCFLIVWLRLDVVEFDTISVSDSSKEKFKTLKSMVSLKRKQIFIVVVLEETLLLFFILKMCQLQCLYVARLTLIAITVRNISLNFYP